VVGLRNEQSLVDRSKLTDFEHEFEQFELEDEYDWGTIREQGEAS
jgi:hypothetical protein